MRFTTALSIGIGLGLVGCNSGDDTASDAAPVVVNPQGFSLYANDLDTSTTIACVSTCTQYWVPAATAQETSQDPNFGTVTRADDGTTQVTYNGQPLYTFYQDTSPGQLTGDFVTDEFGSASFFWAAARIGQEVSAPSGGGGGGGAYPPPGGGGGGYGY